MNDSAKRAMGALNVLAKWRVLFTGWQLGTRPKGDPECAAVSDHREVTLLLRVEASAMALLLVEKGVITQEEWAAALEREALLLNKEFEQRFPGVTASEAGLHMGKRAAAWMKGWKS